MKMPNYSSLSLAILALSGLSQLSLAAPGYKSGSALPVQYSKTINASDNGVRADDGRDDTAAIQAIINSIDINNDPNNLIRILLPKGTINISDEIHVDRSGIVIEGAGKNPNTGTNIVVKSWRPYDIDSKNAPEFDKHFWPGFGVFRTETRLMHPKKNQKEGGINLHWNHSIEVDRPAKEGDTVLAINQDVEKNFSVGDLIYVGAANDNRFLDMAGVVESKRNNGNIRKGHMRNQIFKVVAINAQTDEVTIDKPLEFDIALKSEANYQSRVMPVKAVENVGYRNFYLTMSNKGTNCEGLNTDTYSQNNPNGVRFRYLNMCAESAIHGIVFKWAYNGFVDNVKVEMMGSHPIVTEFAKNMTFKNNVIDGSWNKGAGGNGYFRGSKLYDSLIEGNRIEHVRHLTLQWSATGNVVRNNYLNADINLHGGWERNNIIYNNETQIPFIHRSWKTNGKPKNGEQVSGKPSDETWQPFWYASGDHASNWAGPSGPNNIVVNNNFNKAITASAPITRWNLFDTANIKYSVAWDGQQYQHVNYNGNIVPTWSQEIAESVASQMPSSGVYLESITKNDLDNDGVNNGQDQCPATAANQIVGANGCKMISNDTDGDGILNSSDSCPNTLPGAIVDTEGCEIISERDDDMDGVVNSQDQCPNSLPNQNVDTNGCEIIVTKDSDNDGVVDNQDQCPNTPQGVEIDRNGCEIIIEPIPEVDPTDGGQNGDGNQGNPSNEPPVTETPVNQPPVTETPVSQPPVTETPVSQPPVTQPPLEQPKPRNPIVQPPVSEPVDNTPPINQPVVGQPTGPAPTNPPVIERPVTQPPAVQPPVTQTPVVTAPPSNSPSDQPVAPVQPNTPDQINGNNGQTNNSMPINAESSEEGAGANGLVWFVMLVGLGYFRRRYKLSSD